MLSIKNKTYIGIFLCDKGKNRELIKSNKLILKAE